MRRGANEYSLDGKTCVAMDNCVTVKDHTKKIYPKVGVHSRMELAALVGRWKANEKE